jgi:hypothetical protein
MKLSDIKTGEIFTIEETLSYPKKRTNNGYIDIKDNIVIITDDLSWEIRLLTKEELKQFALKDVGEVKE